jgi:hypothetical protein
MKSWDEITDAEFTAACRLAYETVTTAEGGWRKEWFSSHDVLDALANPTAPTRNMRRGLGLLPRHGPGRPPQGAVTRRLRKLAAAGELEELPLVSPRARRPAGYGYKIR